MRVHYILKALRKVERLGARTIEVRPEAQMAFATAMDKSIDRFGRGRLHELVPEGSKPGTIALLAIAIRRPERQAKGRAVQRHIALPGLMQAQALTVNVFLEFAARWHGQNEVIERNAASSIKRSTYADIEGRARKLSSALNAHGIREGNRVATLAMNSIRHLEAWYSIMGMGAVCHTLNPRLVREQLIYIVNHAADRIILADAAFAELATSLLDDCPCVELLVLMPDGSAQTTPPCISDYDAFLNGAPAVAPPWGDFDEWSACGLCYTSGTTGNPKGVLYSHRSNYLHAVLSLQRGVTNLSAADVVMPIVPMFHANAWGLAFSAPAVGAKLVMPGARLDGESLHGLIEQEGVTFSAGVPTVWQGLLQHLGTTGKRLESLKRVLIAGSACPESIIRTLEDQYGVEVLHAWGMTETSPIGATAAPSAKMQSLPLADRRALSLKQGRPFCGIDLAISDDLGAMLPHDGASKGHLLVRGASVVRTYFGEDSEAVDAQGWFDTGDIATIDEYGFVQITDRAKDIIKSGGEWISSVEIENLAVGHPKAERAAVIGVRHEKWGERPLLLVKLRPGETAAAEEFRQYLEGRIARWWMPDEIRFVNDLPLGATGKIDKKRIRETLLGATP